MQYMKQPQQKSDWFSDTSQATINIEINYFISESILEDRVEDALDYKSITKQVIQHVEEGRFLLLEKLVADVVGICSRPPSVKFARVAIDKPHALRFADSVSLALEYHARQDKSLTLLEKAS
jgi:D-erythro-7,8-dihydroneopterin triphosphate epimerase